MAAPTEPAKAVEALTGEKKSSEGPSSNLTRPTKSRQALDLARDGKGKGLSKRLRPGSAPGPGSYDDNKNTVKHRSPGWSWGAPKGARPASATSPKSPAKAQEPGPVPDAGRDPAGQVDFAKHRAPKFSFGNTNRVTSPSAGNVMVGPGSYNPAKIAHRAPRYSMQGRPPPEKPAVAGTESGDLFKSAYVASGIRESTAGKAVGVPPADEAKSAADLPDVEGAPAAEGAAEGEAGASGEGSTAVVKAPTTGSAGFKENLDGATNVDWKSLSEKLPTKNDEKSKKRRKELWKRADPNGNGYLSSAEVDLMVRDTVGEEMFSAKPVIQSAFHAARKSGGGKQTGRAADYIERKEFRTLLIMLRQYYELYAMFNRLDTSDDRRIDSGEFTQGAEMVKGWGVEVGDPDAEFAAIDIDGGGKILFDEFAKWGILKALDLPEDDDFDDGGETAKHDAVGYVEERDGFGKSKIVTREPQPRMSYTVIGAQVPVQTMPRADRPPEARGPFSQYSKSMAKSSHIFQSPGPGRLPIVGGLPFRKIMPGSKFLPHTEVPKGGTTSGLPFALSQLLLEKAKEDREAQQAMLEDKKLTFEDRSYGAIDLASPVRKKDGDKKALEDKGAAGSKSSAKVAPA